MGEEDPGREIFGYCSHIPVPKWVDKNAYSNCKHCNIKFSSVSKSNQSHHCRLCGEMYCGSCTQKFHIPIVYEQKGKKGPTRVCMKCKESCLAQKAKEKLGTGVNEEKKKYTVLHSLDETRESIQANAALRANEYLNTEGVLEIAPPDWEEAEKFEQCHKCAKKAGKAHNCRTCGRLFCSDCTSKMVVPPFFERKKKSGPCRVCDECRFKILGGAKLVEHLSKDQKKEDRTMLCIVDGCKAQRVSNNYCADHANEYGEGKTALSTTNSIGVRWEGESNILARVAVTNKEDMNLTHIDVAFRKLINLPEPFDYIFRHEVISPIFYDIFTPAVIGPTLYIRKKVDQAKILAEYNLEEKTKMDAEVVAVSNENNPFKRSEEAERKKLEAERREKEEAERRKQVFKFHKPTLQPKSYTPLSSSSFRSGDAANNKTKAVPPPLPGAKGPPPPPLPTGAAPPPLPVNNGPVSDDMLKARAKTLFGAA